MIALLCFVLNVLVSPFKSTSRLEAENAALRHQVVMLRRIVHRRVRLTNSDRIFFIQLYRWFPSVLKVIAVIRPETLVRWHRAGFRRYWRWKSRSFGGRPQIGADLRALIRRMSVDNPLWGAPRIHGELLKLGFEVAQSSVAKYMVKKCGPPSQGWCTFLRNHAPDIAAMDLFVVPSIGLDLLYALVIVRLARRDLVWINVTTHPTADWITTSASSRISLRTCCQCRGNSRCLPIAAMYSHASRIVRSMPPSFVGRGGMSFLERYAGGRAARQDDSRVVILVIILLAIGASFVATGGLLAEAKDAPHRTLNLGLAAATIIVAAAVTQVVFTLHYAHEYYRPSGGPQAFAEGLDFRGDRNPDYWGFFYFATWFGAASQTSDVSICADSRRCTQSSRSPSTRPCSLWPSISPPR